MRWVGMKYGMGDGTASAQSINELRACQALRKPRPSVALGFRGFRLATPAELTSLLTFNQITHIFTTTTQIMKRKSRACIELKKYRTLQNPKHEDNLQRRVKKGRLYNRLRRSGNLYSYTRPKYIHVRLGGLNANERPRMRGDTSTPGRAFWKRHGRRRELQVCMRGPKTWPFSLQTSRSSCTRQPTPLIELELAKQQRDPMVEGDDEGCLCDEMVEMQALKLTKVPDLVY